MEDRLDKDNESYLDGLLETFGQEPPYETDRRRKATARAKSGSGKISSTGMTVDSLEEEFNIDDLDDSFLDDMDLDELVSPLEDVADNSEVSAKDIQAGNENEDIESEEPAQDEDVKNPEETTDSDDIETEETVLEDTPVDEVTEISESTDEEPEIEADSGEETGLESGEELATEIGEELGAEIGEELGTEIGEELGGEIGEEIGGDTGSDEEDEISFDETGAIEADDSLPLESSLDDMGEPEILSDKEIKSGKSSKKGKSGKKDTSGKKGFFAGVFHKLFANIPLTEEELAAIPTPEQEEEARKEKEAEAAKKKEEKKAAADVGKKKKAEEAKKKAADNKAKKAAKDAAKKAAKKEAELKRLRAEALEQPEGKINKAGAIIIFLFFIVAAAVVIVGTNIFSYDISIADATYKFGNHKYTEAYEGIRGLEIKEKDMEIHDKIYTVMFVNKQLNSYNNFFAMGDYASALDSLIKGLSRYDKYIALARQLGIHTDLDYVRKQIMAELQNVYGVSEREALELMEMTDRQDYSERIYAIVSKLDTKAIEAEKERRELVP